MRFGSVCSGIEAASVAWEPLGWKAAWLSEIEPFPSAVLKHHYPDVPNLGDMTQLPDLILRGEVEAPDLFCGGTPCQAFSVAGLRKSLDDARGNLSLTFCEIANAIDHIRSTGGDDPCIVFWENVPGVLSTKDNAFGCFLAGLAGEDDPLVPPGGKWANAGCVYGPTRAVAWRVLDAQYFGVAQRRKRVFVVASARDGFDPAAVLFEFDGVRRDTAPSREAGEKPAGTIAARFGISRNNHEECVAHTLLSRRGGFDLESETPVVSVCPTLRAGGNKTGGDRPPGTDVDTADSLIPIFFHPTQDPIHSTEVCHSISGGNRLGCATAAVAIDTYNGTITGDLAAAITARQGIPDATGPRLMHAMQVRRLTPVECERLQGFPDGYTAIPWRKKPAEECPDGPRYKALGNSWAVPVVRWIGQRIHNAVLLTDGERMGVAA